MNRLYPSDDFEVTIRILTPDEGGPGHPVYNGVKWDFAYAVPIPEAGDWCIWPDFHGAGGDSYPGGVPLPVGVGVSARMFIMADEMREMHRRHIRPGVRFYCIEGPRRVAEGEVTVITGLMEPRTHAVRVAQGSLGDSASGAPAAVNYTPTDPEVLNPYRRHTRLAFVMFAVIALNFTLGQFPDRWVSTTVTFLSIVAMCVLIYLMMRERREVKSRLLRYRGLPGHCMHCGWYQQDEKRKRCISCSKLLDANPAL